METTEEIITDFKPIIAGNNQDDIVAEFKPITPQKVTLDEVPLEVRAQVEEAVRSGKPFSIPFNATPAQAQEKIKERALNTHDKISGIDKLFMGGKDTAEALNFEARKFPGYANAVDIIGQATGEIPEYADNVKTGWNTIAEAPSTAVTGTSQLITETAQNVTQLGLGAVGGFLGFASSLGFDAGMILKKATNSGIAGVKELVNQPNFKLGEVYDKIAEGYKLSPDDEAITEKVKSEWVSQVNNLGTLRDTLPNKENMDKLLSLLITPVTIPFEILDKQVDEMNIPVFLKDIMKFGGNAFLSIGGLEVLKGEVKNGLTGKSAEIYNRQLKDYIANDIPKAEAELKATEDVIKTPEGKEQIHDIIQNAIDKTEEQGRSYTKLPEEKIDVEGLTAEHKTKIQDSIIASEILGVKPGEAYDILPELKHEMQDKGLRLPTPEEVKAGVEAKKVEQQKTQAEGKKTTGVTKDIINQEREARGLPEVPVTEREIKAFEEGKQLVDSGEINPRSLAKALVENARPLTDSEVSALRYDRIKLSNEHQSIMNEIEKAIDNGDKFKESEGRIKLLENEELTNINDTASRLGGRELGRGLREMQNLIAEDFSFGGMIQKTKVATGRKELTAELRKKIEKLSKELADATKNFEDFKNEVTVKKAEDFIKKLQEDVAREARKSKRTYTKEELAKEFDSLSKELDSVLGGQLNIGLDPKAIVILGKMALNKVKSGIITATDIADAIYTDLKGTVSKQDILDALSELNITKEEAIKRVKKLKGDIVKESKSQEIQDPLKAVKKRLENAIKKNAEQIIEGQKRKVKGLTYDQEVKELQAINNILRDALNELDKKTSLSEEQKLRVTEANLDKAIAGYNKKIAEQDFSTKERKAQKTLTPYIEELRTLKDELKHKFQSMKSMAKDKKDNAERELNKATNAIEKSIATYERRVINRELPTKAEKTAIDNPILNELTIYRDALKEKYKEILAEGKPTPEEKATQNAIRATEKSIAEYERRIRENDLTPQKKESTTPETPELKALRERRDELKNIIKEMKDVKEKSTQEDKVRKARVTRMTNQIKDLERRIKENDFAPKAKNEYPLAKNEVQLQFERDILKEQFNELLVKEQMKDRTALQKTLGGGTEIANLARAIMTSVDLTAVLRQGAFIGFGSPVLATKALPSMFKAMMSERGRYAIDLEIKQRANYPLYKQMRLALTERGRSLGHMEEAYMSRLVASIPKWLGGGLIRGSERAYSTYLNRQRADKADQLFETLSKNRKPTKEEIQTIGNLINDATGRGNLGHNETNLVGLNTIFFAPRLVVSRFNLLLGKNLFKGSNATRKIVAKEYAKFLIGVSVVYGLSQMAGAEVETDSRSSDFGKIRFGKTRLDPLAGLSQVTVLLRREISGEKKSIKGKVTPIRGDKVPYGGDDSFDIGANFLRTKLSPIFGAGVNIAVGKNVVGEKVTVAGEAGKLLVPMTFNDIYEAMQEQGIEKGTALGLLAIFGMGLQTFDEKHKK